MDAGPGRRDGIVSHEDRLVACFSCVFPALSPAEIRAADMRRLGTWDSAALLRLLARVEREFRIRLESDQINRLTSFDAVLDIVSTLTASRNPRST